MSNSTDSLVTHFRALNEADTIRFVADVCKTFCEMAGVDQELTVEDASEMVRSMGQKGFIVMRAMDAEEVDASEMVVRAQATGAVLSLGGNN